MRHQIILAIFLLLAQSGNAQSGDTTLSLPQALRIAVANFPKIKAAQHLANASALEVKAAKQDGLPDLTAGAELAYGTLNGLNGLSSGEPGLTSLTNGPVTTSQNYNAAFGALYITNIDFNLYSFGLQRAHVAAAKGQYEQDKSSLSDQIFQQQVQTAAAYLNLLAARQVRLAMEANLTRTLQLRDVILARTLNGLNAGVDSSIADAEVSKARLTLIDAKNFEQQQANKLSIQMGITPQPFRLDTATAETIPGNLLESANPDFASHPDLRFLASRITTSDLAATYLQKTGLPHLSLFGVGQERGSGFGPRYGSDLSDYTTNFIDGIQPQRANYLLGLAFTWDITNLGRSHSRAAAQRQRSQAYAQDYQLQQNTLVNQLALSNQQLQNALEKYNETPTQLRAATDAYEQKKALYENGLTNIVDVSQTLYLLNRAEIDRDIACNAVWQALLFKAGTAGDLNPFLQQF
jgi:outer membrane protein TolC